MHRLIFHDLLVVIISPVEYLSIPSSTYIFSTMDNVQAECRFRLRSLSVGSEVFSESESILDSSNHALSLSQHGKFVFFYILHLDF